MPKATPATQVSTTTPYATNPNILKRNQACHQCRRRKLKCDAKRPCSTCVRSHRNTVKSLGPGAPIPLVDCTFDEAETTTAAVQITPKNRYERLESRINELEAMLRQKDQSDVDSVSGDGSLTNGLNGDHVLPATNDAPFSLSYDSMPFSSLDQNDPTPSFNTGNLTSIDDSLQHLQGFVSTSMPDGLSHSVSFNVETTQFSPENGDASPIIPAHIAPVSSTPIEGVTPPDSSPSNTVTWPAWPHNLCNPVLLHHLANAFFSFHPHAGRMFHMASFMASLALPPNHPNFPPTSVLHAVCAVGSCYTAAVKQPPMPNYAEMSADEIFLTRQRRNETRNDSFGEKHYKLALIAIDDNTLLGEYLVETVQGLVLLSWYAHFHARWSDVFLLSGRAVRSLIPLGLNMCPPFHSISPSLRAPSILPPARTVIEDELRRNVFWLAYAMERMHSSGNGWAMSLDDQDVSQLMPVQMNDFANGVLVPPDKRQWAHGPDILFVHPPEQTDSFILFIKSTILLSRVKNFNLRFRTKNYSGDPAMIVSQNNENVQTNTAWLDPRATEGFKEVDNLLTTFHDTFPRGMRDPIHDNVIDSHLMSACLAPHVGTILLHDPHADVRFKGCRSAQNILKAARAILDYTYTLWSTSFDITLVDNYFLFSWFMTGRVLIRFLKSAKDIDDQVLYMQYGTELEFVRIVLGKVGERVPLASRYAKMLDDLIVRIVSPTDKLVFYNSMPKLLDSSDSMHFKDGFLQDVTTNRLELLLDEPFPSLTFS